jgi:methylated-DNA-[protein]-cysteine S-methyltransferase
MVKHSRIAPNFSMFVHYISSPFGEVAVLWHVHEKQPKVYRVILSSSARPAVERVRASFPAASNDSCREINDVSEKMESFLSGDDVEFSLEQVRMDLCSDFQEKVLRAEHAVPRGWVSTYRRLAAHTGKPNGARAAGRCLSNNPFPLIIPCHRIIRSDGTLGGYQGGVAMKRALLKMEGVSVWEDGTVAEGRFYY